MGQSQTQSQSQTQDQDQNQNQTQTQNQNQNQVIYGDIKDVGPVLQPELATASGSILPMVAVTSNIHATDRLAQPERGHDEVGRMWPLPATAQTSPSKHDSRVQVEKKTGSKEDLENKVEESEEEGDNIIRDVSTVLHGWRLWVSIFGLSLGLFLSALETTIVATALINISEAFKTYDKAGWIVVSYMLTYTGFLIVYAKLSDILGKKNMMLLGIAIFTVFSMFCGFSQTITQLIVFRAFQGLGASGIYSMVSVIVPTIVSIKDIAKFMTIISSVFVLSSILGPVLGGAITDKASWRWVFWLNGPAGCFAFTILLFSLPVEPTTGTESVQETIDGEASNIAKSTGSKLRKNIPKLDFSTTFTRQAISRIDLGGALLSLAFSILLVFALQEGGVDFPWSSPTIIATLTAGVVCFFLFILWEEWIVGDHRKSLHPGFINHRLMPAEACEPIFPMRLTKHRVIASLLLTGFFTGFPFMTVLFNLPQRFQTVNQLSATATGLRLLPLLLSSAFATAVAGVVIKTMGKGSTRILWYLIVIGSGLQFIGITLLGTALGKQQTVQPQQYVYQFIFGCGMGFALSTLAIACRVEVSTPDMAVVMGAIVQVRVLGGCIALALCSALLHYRLEVKLAGVVSREEMTALFKSTQFMRELGEERFEIVREVYADGYALQMKIMIAFAGAAVVTSLGAWNRKWKVIEGLG